jgi:6-phosphogluconolactonase
LKIEVLDDAGGVARRAAEFIADEARTAVQARGRFTLAVSGGRTPWQMLRALAAIPLPWSAVQLFQVDERVAPAGDADRNLTHIRESLLSKLRLPSEQLHPMPVEDSDLAAAALRYARGLEDVAGTPPVIDVVHLGLGPDGHTASLVPGDRVLGVTSADVAVAGPYQGRLRMTLTYPALNRARRIVFLVTGADKADALMRLCDGDATIPAGRVDRSRAVLIADRAAAGRLAAKSAT